MALTPICDSCGNELTEFGGILLSPPNAKSSVKKFHICIACYQKMVSSVGIDVKNDPPE